MNELQEEIEQDEADEVLGASWPLLSNHGAVLFYVAIHPDATIRQIAAELELTERRVSAIILDLRKEGRVAVTRCGRRNSYRVNDELSLRPRFIKHVPVSAFVRLISQVSAMALMALGICISSGGDLSVSGI